MLGKRINKPVRNWSEYTEAAQWCNANGAMIEDKGDYYEVVEVPVYEPSDEEKAQAIRAERDNRIAKTDYMLMPDYPIDAEYLEQVKMYRQALRDITLQDDFPNEVIWPELPTKGAVNEEQQDEQEDSDSLSTQESERVLL